MTNADKLMKKMVMWTQKLIKNLKGEHTYLRLFLFWNFLEARKSQPIEDPTHNFLLGHFVCF